MKLTLLILKGNDMHFDRSHLCSMALASLLLGSLTSPAFAQFICESILAGGTFRTLARQENSYSNLVYGARLKKMSYQEA